MCRILLSKVSPVGEATALELGLEKGVGFPEVEKDIPDIPE